MRSIRFLFKCLKFLFKCLKFLFKYTKIFIKFLIRKGKTRNENSTYNSIKFYFTKKNYGVRTNNELAPKRGIGWPLFLFLLSMDLCIFAIIVGYYIIFYPYYYAKRDLGIFLGKCLKLLGEVLLVYYAQRHIFVILFIVFKHIVRQLYKFFMGLNLRVRPAIAGFCYYVYRRKFSYTYYNAFENIYINKFQLQQDCKWKYSRYFIF